MWNEADGFYYDAAPADGRHMPLKVRSMVGLIPLFAVETLEPRRMDRLPGSSAHGLVHRESPRPDAQRGFMADPGKGGRGGCSRS